MFGVGWNFFDHSLIHVSGERRVANDLVDSKSISCDYLMPMFLNEQSFKDIFLEMLSPLFAYQHNIQHIFA